MSEMQGDWSGPPQDPGIRPGVAIRLSKYVWRLTAGNAGRMTGPGTNSYLVGAGNDWSIIDPGPADDRHMGALIAAASGKVRQILVTHTHEDHSPGAMPLKSATGAPLLGQTTTHRRWQDPTFAPDRELHHDDRVTVGGATLRAIHTPGHASNHICFLLEEERILFTGDHIMQGTTPVIDPPDGDMTDYIRALESLLREPLDYLAPGHGTLMPEPQSVIQTLIKHRLWREAKVLASLPRQHPEDLPTLVRRAYDDVSVQLHALAERSLLAHLLKLEADGRARRSGEAWISVDVASPKP